MVFKQRLRLARGHSNLLRLAGGTAFKQLLRLAGGWWYLNNYVQQGVKAITTFDSCLLVRLLYYTR